MKEINLKILILIKCGQVYSIPFFEACPVNLICLCTFY